METTIEQLKPYPIFWSGWKTGTALSLEGGEKRDPKSRGCWHVKRS